MGDCGDGDAQQVLVGPQWRIVTKQPAHRPSRRDDIVDAAIRVFADKGYADAAISDIADTADVAVTAIYYHFAGKDDLFAAAMRTTLDSISAVVVAARPSAGAANADGLRATIDAVWDWIDEHPQGASLVHVQLPGTTRQLATIRQEFIELHEQRAFDYLNDASSRKDRTASARIGASTLTMRTLVDVLMALHAMRLGDGPLSTASPSALRREAHRLARRLLT